MDSRSLLLALVLLTTSVASVGSGLPDAGDPGPGLDAGNSPGDATPLPEGGVYNGTLLPPVDADWFLLDTTSQDAVCYQALIGGDVRADVTLSLDENLENSSERPIGPEMILDLGIATTMHSQVFLGLEPRTDPELPEASAGLYRFDLRAVEADDLGPEDAGTGEDAGRDQASAIQTEGPCIAGQLSGDDDVDNYTFNLSEGERLTFSLALPSSAPISLTAVSPSGQETKLNESGVETLVADQTGSWLLEVSATSNPDEINTPTDYMVGLTVNGPNEPPCKPGCFTSMG